MLKQKIKEIANKFNIEIRRIDQNQIGRNPFFDISKFLKTPNPVIFDIGANTGQSVIEFAKYFPDCYINSFEPSPKTFSILEDKLSNFKNLKLWNKAVGSKSGHMTFLENTKSDMSSFLPLAETGWGEIVYKTEVEVIDLDGFCMNRQINRIDILKSDTQGYEFEVFKGAQNMIANGNIGIIYYEAIFSSMYKDLPSFGEVFDFLAKHKYSLVTIYPISYQNNLASWTDLLFVHQSLIQ